MKWYNYVAALFAGMFLFNAIPHFVNGVSGDAFPTPFSNPPGKGLSSPTINVIWAFVNLLVGWLLYRAGKLQSKNKIAIVLFFIGGIAMSIMLSMTFAEKMAS